MLQQNSCSVVCFVVRSWWRPNTGAIWKGTVMCTWIFYFFLEIPFFVLYRDPAGIPKEDEKAGPAVQREAPKCRQAKKNSACAFILTHPCWPCSLSVIMSWAFCSFALSELREKTGPHHSFVKLFTGGLFGKTKYCCVKISTTLFEGRASISTSNFSLEYLKLN